MTRVPPNAGDAVRAAQAFVLGSRPTQATPLGDGHIHSTWRVETEASGLCVLQCMNDSVFPDLQQVIENSVRVTAHLQARIPNTVDSARQCLQMFPTHDGAWLHEDSTGAKWRASAFIPNTRTFQTAPNVQVAHEAARSFGAFAVSLSDLAPESLHVPLPGFHDFAARVSAFEIAARTDPHSRAQEITREIDAFATEAEALKAILHADAMEALPVRVVHNDCKLNNVLFDAQEERALCVIDLDTVMPGSLLHDFGDLGRTAACPLDEDCLDLDRVVADPEYLRAVTQGYARATESILVEAERELFPLAGPLITLETGLRFLTDHLEGDSYFGVVRPGQNLDRARMQLALFGSLRASESIVRHALKTL